MRRSCKLPCSSSPTALPRLGEGLGCAGAWQRPPPDRTWRLETGEARVRAWRAIGVAAALSLMGSNAYAASVFDLFEALCIESGADPSVVLAKADRMGWRKAPRRLVRVLTKASEPGEVTTGAAGRGVQDQHGLLAVVVARTSWMVPRREIPADTCSVVAAPGIDVEAVAQEVETYAAVPGRSGLAFQKSAVGYLWRDIDGRREPLTPEQLQAEPHVGDVKMLVIMKFEDMVVLQLFVPAKDLI